MMIWSRLHGDMQGEFIGLPAQPNQLSKVQAKFLVG
jgi:hypothetical protein